MPQITLEYTANLKQYLDLDGMFSRIHNALVEVCGISVENCKSRAIQLDRFYVGDGKPDNAFMHLEIKILEGRSKVLKKELGERLLNLLKVASETKGEEVAPQITVEIIDIERVCYFKYPEGSMTPINC